MTRHPALCVGQVKEFHYFDNLLVAHKTTDNETLRKRYEKNFRLCGRGNLTFDATPMNWILPHLITSSYTSAELTEKKFVVVLRHPVDREYSWYNHQVRGCLASLRSKISTRDTDMVAGKTMLTNAQYTSLTDKNSLTGRKICALVLRNETELIPFEKTTPDSILLKNIKSFAEYSSDVNMLRGDSLYHWNILQWLRFIDRSQLLIFNFEHVSQNSSDTIKRISEFFGIDHLWADTRKNPGVISSILPGTVLDCKSADRLNAYFDKQNKDLLTLVNDDDKKPRSEPTLVNFKAEYKCRNNN